MAFLAIFKDLYGKFLVSKSCFKFTGHFVQKQFGHVLSKPFLTLECKYVAVWKCDLKFNSSGACLSAQTITARRVVLG